MQPYLIEIRLQGYSKKYAKELMDEIGRRFRLRRAAFSSGGVPHITMYGPFNTSNEQRMISEVVSVCQKYNRIPLTFRGFDYFDRFVKTIYIDIEPSETLKQLRLDLAQTLLPITNSISPHDREGKDDFCFHSTLVFKHITHLFPHIWEHIQSKPKPNINQTLLRITILKRGRILYEYDFLQRRLLNRTQALSRLEFAKTIHILKDKPRDYKLDNLANQSDNLRSKTKRSNSNIWTKLLHWIGAR